MSRRKFINSTVATIGLMSAADSLGRNNKPKIKAIAFDGLAIFDQRPVFNKASNLFPEKGKQLIEIWKSKQFSYQWLRVSANRYKNFHEVTKDALNFALAHHDLNLTESDKTAIMNTYKTMTSWPDVSAALQALKNQNLKTCILSNMTDEMLRYGIQNSNTERFFDYVISTDKQRTYKPSPVAYQMGIDTLDLQKEEILFVAFAGWDMTGAKWFGYPTFWLNRSNSLIEKLDAEPDGMGTNLHELVAFVVEYNND